MNLRRGGKLFWLIAEGQRGTLWGRASESGLGAGAEGLSLGWTSAGADPRRALGRAACAEWGTAGRAPRGGGGAVWPRVFSEAGRSWTAWTSLVRWVSPSRWPLPVLAASPSSRSLSRPPGACLQVVKRPWSVRRPTLFYLRRSVALASPPEASRLCTRVPAILGSPQGVRSFRPPVGGRGGEKGLSQTVAQELDGAEAWERECSLRGTGAQTIVITILDPKSTPLPRRSFLCGLWPPRGMTTY